MMAKKPAPADATPSWLIDRRIRDTGGWRGAVLAQCRAAIRAADPAIVEEWKWEIPVWSRDGLICTGEVYKNAVKLTFARGAFVADPGKLFNASLEGNLRRAIDFKEGDVVDAAALTSLVRAAVAANRAKPAPAKAAKARTSKATPTKKAATKARKAATKKKAAKR